jgi:hypothetical protein
MLGRLRSLIALRGNPGANQIVASLGINDTPGGPNVSV